MEPNITVKMGGVCSTLPCEYNCANDIAVKISCSLKGENYVIIYHSFAELLEDCPVAVWNDMRV